MSHLHWLQARMANTVAAGVVPYRDASGFPPLRGVTLEELKEHSTRSSLWLCMHSKVYDCTAYASRHPGGIPQLLRGAGIDSTALFQAVHPWVNLDLLLGPAFLVGDLVASEGVGGGSGSVEAEEPWLCLEGVRPLGATAPPTLPAGKAAPALSLPSATCQSALDAGALVLWQQRSGGGGVYGAWPWGATCGVPEGQLCVVARGRAALGLPALASRLQGAAGLHFIWDMRGIEALPWAHRAAATLKSLTTPPHVLLEEAAGPAEWAEGLRVQRHTAGKDPLLQVASKGFFPKPHAALIVLAVSSEPSSGQWETEWEDELRSSMYSADLLLAVTAPP